MRPVDLHSHTTRSDGTFSPAELVRHAAAKGLAAVAVTDHDTAEGVAEALETAEELAKELEACAEESAKLDEKMLRIRERIARD